MKFSIITATYNSAVTILDCLDSINKQTFPDVEHIVIDGASSDDTGKIVSYHAPKSVLFSEKDDGIYDAMNKGLSKVSGDIIGILNSDDAYISSTILQKVADLFDQSQADAIYGDLVYSNPETGKITRKWKAGTFSKKAFLYGWMPPHPTFFVKKKVYEQFGGFNLNLYTAADYELMLRFLYRYGIKVAYLPEVLVNMRTGGASNRSIQNRLLANKGDRMAWEINQLKPYWFTLYMKPLRKISQFLIR
jgi:glycosyltransferase involved in cell wall biosynthesis